MKTVGEILKDQRQKKQLTLEEISRKTKIQEKYLVSLEKNDFKHLPTGTFVKGFIQNYAQAIGVNPQTALAIFRRDFIEDRQGRIIPKSLLAPIEKKVVVSPKMLSNGLIAIGTLVVTSLFARQIILFYQGPEINLEKPQENQQVTSPLEISGTAKNTAELFINNQQVVLDEQGQFNREIQLSPGDHTITISAKSQDDKTKIVQRHIVVSP